ncbi:histidinol-phosphate aminotransferase [Streptosporangium album]|uniref:Aminotransferase n=1 Tax=Streptosporangium album TaxID=47479 RepID=A0A7W7RQZ8_9ACTN|nr:histidinol-phosphate transaminase [Streptosporangium album]MBB4936576.1 histidinol-phosphate aminotransferase [Streptosporangium album]
MRVGAGNRVREAVRELGPAGPSGPRPESRGLINLRSNENPFGGAYRRYPDNDLGVLARRYLAALDAVEPPPQPAPYRGWDGENVLMTRGAVDALDLVLRTFFEPGADAVAVTPPNFGFFDRLAAIHGIARCPVPLGGERFDRLDVERLVSLPVRGVLLCDPNNPSSTRLDAGDLDRLLDRFEGLVIIDETYVEFDTRASHRHRVGAHPNLIVLRSLSKGFGMAGLRLGAILADPVVVAAIGEVRPPFAVPVPVIERALDELADPSVLRRRIESFVEERGRLVAALSRCPRVIRVFGDAGFVTVEVGDLTGAAAALRHARIDAVINPEGWQRRIRVSVGSRHENAQLIAALSAEPGHAPPAPILTQ